MPETSPTPSHHVVTLREPPPPLWRFGRAGRAAVLLASALLIAHAAGIPLFYNLMRWTSNAIGWTRMTRLMTGLYGGLWLISPWYDLRGPPTTVHPIFIAGILAGLAIPGRLRRWPWVGALAAASFLMIAAGFSGGPTMRWYLDCAELVMGRVAAATLWFQLPLLLSVPLAAGATGSWRSIPWFVGFWLAGAAIAALETAPSSASDPVILSALPYLRWGWHAGWWAWWIAWGVRERRRRWVAAGCCEACLYDLSGLAAPVCPECGAAVQQPCWKALTKSS